MTFALIAGVAALIIALLFLFSKDKAPLNQSGYTYPGTPGA